MAQWLHRYSVGSRLVLVQSLCTDRMKIHHQHFGFHMFLVVSMMSIARRHKHTHHTHRTAKNGFHNFNISCSGSSY